MAGKQRGPHKKLARRLSYSEEKAMAKTKAPPKGTPSLHRFFQPSPQHKKKSTPPKPANAENQPHQTTLAANTTVAADARPKQPLQPPTQQAQDPPHVYKEIHALGLVRCKDQTHHHKTFSCCVKKGTIQRVFPNALLGRNVTLQKETSSQQNQKINLHIGPSTIGVSRKHLRILEVCLEVRNPHIRLQQCDRALNPSLIHRHGGGSERLFPGESTVLIPGDVVVLDAYDPNPVHLFRLVVEGSTWVGETICIPDSPPPAVVAPVKPTIQICDSPETVTPTVVASGTCKSTATKGVDEGDQPPPREPVHDASVEDPAVDEAMEVDKTHVYDTTPPVESAEPMHAPEQPTETVDDKTDPVAATDTQHVPLDVAAAGNQAVPSNKFAASPAKKVVVDDDDDKILPESADAPEKVEDKTLPAEMEPVVRTPQVDQYFRVLFDMKNQLFGTTTREWYVGQAIKISNKKKDQHTLTLRFNDGSEMGDFRYPEPEVQLLTSDSNQPHKLFLECRDAQGSLHKTLVQDKAPTELWVGDEVECQFQQGQYPQKWYRGRVAAVNETQQTCEIAYYDKEYEYDIPLVPTGNIILLERGMDNLEWLIQRKVPVDLSCRKPRTGTVVGFGRKNDNVFIRVKLSDGTIETRSYADIVKGLFAGIRKGATKRVAWPLTPGTGGDRTDGASDVRGTPVVRTPKVNDQFRARVNLSNSLFGKPTISREWCIGRAIKVAKTKKTTGKRVKNGSAEPQYSLTLLFSDGSEIGFAYPSADVNILTCYKNEPGKLFVELRQTDSGAIQKKLVYDNAPEEVAVGDIVEGRFQNGRDNPPWYRGRIASVDIQKGTCDIAYCCDREYESDVPLYPTGNIVLLERGIDNLEWLKQRKVAVDLEPDTTTAKQRKNQRSNKSARIGTIVSFGQEGTGDVFVRVKLPGGKVETRSYSEVLESLFLAIRREATSTFTWPSSNKKPGKSARSSRTQTQKKESKSMPRKSTKSAGSKRQADEISGAFQDFEKLNAEDLEGLGGATKDDMSTNISRAKRRAIVPISNPAFLHSTLFNSSFRALSSSEPHLGGDLLVNLAVSHGRIPQASQMEKLMEIMKFGPEADKTRYPDPHKMEIVSDCVDTLVRAGSESQAFCNSVPATWSSFESYLLQVNADIYCSPGDTSSITPTSLSRVASSLQVLSCGLSLVAFFMESQLGASIGDDEGKTLKSYRNIAIVKALRDGGKRDVRDSLKFVVRTAAQMWIRLGHFVLSEFVCADAIQAADSGEAFERCTMHARRCTRAMSTIICYTAWLFSAEEEYGMGDRRIAALLAETFRNEIEAATLDVDNFFGTNAKKAAVRKVYLKKMKLRLVMQLDKQFATPLRTNIARTFGLADELAFLLG